MATTDSIPSGWANKQDWIWHGELIRQLYRKHTLAEVMDIMATQHNFRATSKMYKTRIKQWRLDKKHKENEMRAIVRKEKELKDQGKSGEFRIRGQTVDHEDVVRYWERKGMRVEDIIAQRKDANTPEAMECSIILPSPRPEPMTNPERILISIRDYFKGSFEFGTWLATDLQEFCKTTKSQNDTSSLLYALGNQCIAICTLFDKNHFQEAGQTLIAATSDIKTILKAEHPMALTEIFSIIAHLMQRRKCEIALAIIRQISGLAEILLGERHPLHVIFRWLALVNPSQLEDMIVKCSASTAENFEKLVGPMNRSTLLSRLRLIVDVDVGLDTSRREYLLQSLLRQCEGILGYFDDGMLDIRLFLAQHYLKIRDSVKALRLGWYIVSCGFYRGLSISGATPYAEGLAIVAESQLALGDTLSAEVHIRKAIDLRISVWGPRDDRARYWLLRLEDRLATQGQMSSAAQVYTRWKETLPRYNDES